MDTVMKYHRHRTITAEHDCSRTKKEKGKSYKEWSADKEGTSWKSKLRETIDAVLPSAKNFDDFLDRMRQAGYEIKRGERWATIFNLKQAAKTFNYLSEHGIADYAGLLNRMAEIAVLKKHIVNYSKTKKVFDQYKASG